MSLTLMSNLSFPPPERAINVLRKKKKRIAKTKLKQTTTTAKCHEILGHSSLIRGEVWLRMCDIFPTQTSLLILVFHRTICPGMCSHGEGLENSKSFCRRVQHKQQSMWKCASSPHWHTDNPFFLRLVGISNWRLFRSKQIMAWIAQTTLVS